MNHNAMIEVILAQRDGKPLEARRHGTANWVDLTGLTPLFNFQEWDFRVKPEPPTPREWVVIPSYTQTNLRVLSDSEAAFALGTIRVREVL